MTRRSGLSLAETLVSLVILAMVIFASQCLYVGLLRGTTKSERNGQAVAALQTLTERFKDHARDNWSDQEVVIPGQFQNYAYTVTESPPLTSPYDSDHQLPMRMVRVRIEFEDADPGTGEMVKRTKECVVSSSR